MTDVMIDIETLGTGNDSLILSIGAVEFNLKAGVLGAEFSQRLDVKSSQAFGAKLDATTVMWWMQQSAEARGAIGNGKGMMLAEGLDALSRYLYLMAPFSDMTLLNVWGNGSTFDISILEDAYRMTGLKEPWGFRNVRDMRTMVDVCRRYGVSYGKKSVAHTALDDAKAQATHLIHLQNMMFVQMKPHLVEEV